MEDGWYYKTGLNAVKLVEGVFLTFKEFVLPQLMEVKIVLEIIIYKKRVISNRVLINLKNWETKLQL